jgi:hypothetical protein
MPLPSHPVCPQHRDRLVAVAAGEARDRAFDAHVASCVGCGAFLARAQRHVHALTSLPRASAPRDLDGRVVAATQAGARQDRAVRALSMLTRASMPNDVELELWQQTAGDVAARAPAALDALVDARLREQGRGVGERIAAHMTRHKAPASLDRRVADAYELGRRERLRAERRLLFVGGAALFLALLVAASLLVVERRVVNAAGPNVAASRAPQVDGPRIVIERVASPADLDPLLASTFSGLVGGVSDAVRVTGGKL